MSPGKMDYWLMLANYLFLSVVQRHCFPTPGTPLMALETFQRVEGKWVAFWTHSCAKNCTKHFACIILFHFHSDSSTASSTSHFTQGEESTHSLSLSPSLAYTTSGHFQSTSALLPQQCPSHTWVLVQTGSKLSGLTEQALAHLALRWPVWDALRPFIERGYKRERKMAGGGSYNTGHRVLLKVAQLLVSFNLIYLIWLYLTNTNCIYHIFMVTMWCFAMSLW
jgi:hypothetical protein